MQNLEFMQRYSRQQILPGIGEEGQRKLGKSHVLILGCGALGCLTASALIRAGVGRLRLVDRGVVALHNLQRQMLFDEADVRMGLAKAVAAESSLVDVNHQVQVEGIVTNFSSGNALALVEGVDLEGPLVEPARLTGNVGRRCPARPTRQMEQQPIHG